MLVKDFTIYTEALDKDQVSMLSKGGNKSLLCGHVWGDKPVDLGDGTHGYVCADCGEVKDVAEHKTSNKDCSEDSYCDACGKQIGTAGTHSPKWDGDCTKDTKCTICGETVKGNAKHNVADKLVDLGNGKHGKKCTSNGCTYVEGEEAHTFVNGTCACGAKAAPQTGFATLAIVAAAAVSGAYVVSKKRKR